MPELPEAVRRLLADGLGARGGSRAPASISDLEPPAPRLGDDALAALRAVVGAGNVLADDEARIRHLRGKSTPDLLRLRARDLGGAPDLVVLPGSHEEVLSMLQACSERRIAVVPFGGGTSVVGGLEPDAARFAGLVALDMRRMNALIGLDEESRLAVLEPGLRGPQAEELLGERGYTIGHFPQSFEYATLGGFAAARSSGQASAGYGRFDELVLALTVATPAGTIALGRAPKSAAGPDLRQLILGSEGAFGVITSLTLQVRPVPEARVYEGWRFASFADGLAAVRGLAQDGPLPTVLRLSDEAETALNLARPGELGAGGDGGCLAIVGYEGQGDEVAARASRATLALQHAGGRRELGAGEAWERDRYRGPYLRDALLDAGALVETLETVSFWSAVPRLYEAVSGALRDALTDQGTPPVDAVPRLARVPGRGVAVLHGRLRAGRRSGRAVARGQGRRERRDPRGRWLDHPPPRRRHRSPRLVRARDGRAGVGVLRAVKATLDPAGIMNPGVLIRRPPA